MLLHSTDMTTTGLFGRTTSTLSSRDFRSADYRGSWQKQFINHYLDEAYLHGFDRATARFSRFKDEHLPKSLFKFFQPTTHSLVALENHTLRLSSPQSFNDPFDSYVGVEELTYVKAYALKELKKSGLIAANSSKDRLSENEYWKLFHSHSEEREPRPFSKQRELMAEWYSIMQKKSSELQNYMNHIWCEGQRECTRRIQDIRNAPFRVACFSNFASDEELGRNTTMWSHYADNHRGFCTRYSLNLEDSAIASALKCGLYKVIYSSRVSKMSARRLMALQYEADGEPEIDKGSAKTIYRALITKARFWNYEKEWRLILWEDHTDLLNDGTISFPFVDAVYLGCGMDSSLRQHIIRFAKAKGISVYQARKSSEHFELQFVGANSDT